MNYFIVGDIHGCYFTFLEILKQWNRDTEILICVGDFIDRGNHSVRVVEECRKLSSDFPHNTVFLKGNHEAEIIEHVEVAFNDNWVRQCGQKTLDEIKSHQLDIVLWITWLNERPLVFETDFLVVTHAGISHTPLPFEEAHPSSVLWNREPLKNIGKLQIHGHTPLKANQACYNLVSNSWNIDTAACYGYGLTGLKVSQTAKILEEVHIKTDCRDIE